MALDIGSQDTVYERGTTECWQRQGIALCGEAGSLGE